MRQWMNLIENALIFEGRDAQHYSPDTTGLAAWFNPQTGESILEDNSHASMVFDHAERFGYTIPELDEILSNNDNYIDIVNAGISKGWVRISLGLIRHEPVVEVEGGNWSAIRRTVKWMITQGMVTDGVNAEVTSGRSHSHVFLAGEALDRFVRYGVFPRS